MEIPVVKKKNPFTNGYIEVLDVGKIESKQMDTSCLNNLINVHTCKHCAEKISLLIDNELLNFKLSLLSK
jgi:hypothetical protein